MRQPIEPSPRETYPADIGGTFQPQTTETLPILNAANGEHLADTAQEQNKAVDSAFAAFPIWWPTTSKERSLMLLKLSDRPEADIERLAAIDTADVGRVFGEVMINYRVAVEQYRYFAQALSSRTTVHWAATMIKSTRRESSVWPKAWRCAAPAHTSTARMETS
jgi:acyl-CoA reductase-like NAD-dependent aldehyde dehydrogenase